MKLYGTFIFGGTKEKSFKSASGGEINYTSVLLIGEDSDETMNISCKCDVSELKRFEPCYCELDYNGKSMKLLNASLHPFSDKK